VGGRERYSFISFYWVFYVSRGFASLIIPLYFVSVGVPILGVGVAIGVWGVSLLFFEILWGVLLDRMGSGRLVLAAVALTVLTYVLIPFVNSSGGAVITEFVLGASGPILSVVARSGVVRERESLGWASGFGVLGAVYSLAQVTGSFLGSVSNATFGFVDSFYVAAGISVVAYAVYLRLGGSKPPTADRIQRTIASGDEPRPPLDWRGLPMMCLVAVPTFIGFTFFTNIIQLVVTQTPSIHGTDFDAGIVVSSFWLSTAIFQLLLSRRGVKNVRGWIGIALLGSFVVFALFTQFVSVGAIAIGAFVAGAFFSVISPLSLSLLMVGIPKRYTGRAMGIYGAAEDIGVILGPVVGSAVWVEFGLTSAYLTLGATYLVIFVPYAIASRSKPKNLNR
jgi:MFS family permease